jgi:hypothetical protein
VVRRGRHGLSRASCAGTATCTNLGPNGGEPLNVSAPFLDPNAPAYSLVGEAGSRPLTFIDVGPTKVRGPGELRLGYNDEIADYADNSGDYAVTIQTCSPVGHRGPAVLRVFARPAKDLGRCRP